MTTPLSAYQDLVASGTLQDDPAQRHAATVLDRLAHELRRFRPGERRGWFGKDRLPPRGLYLWGGVGVGKSLLMDLFVENAPIAAKRRVHFHAFMQEVHAFIADWRGMEEAARKDHPARAKDASLDDPIPHAAKAVFLTAHLFCFDEFQVTDITDALLLGRLFEHLFERGAVVVATSNRHPDDLYKDGLNRQLFLPFIEQMKERLDILHLVGAKDYRLDRLENEPVFFQPLGPAANDAMNAAWRAMTAGATAENAHLSVHGRHVLIPCSARGCARGTFTHWCGSMFGPADYLAIAAAYPVVFVDQIPRLTPEHRNEAKRFVTFVDALYEARCTLVCSADGPPESLYQIGDGAFEFERTVSRLNEMQSADYLKQQHTADLAQAS